MKLARFIFTLAALVLLSTSAASASATDKPNLKVKNVSTTSASVVAGSRISVTATTVNAGKRKAKKSSTAFVLRARRNQESDTLDIAKKTVKKLNKGGKKMLTITELLSAKVAPGTYFVGACADSAKKIAESKETDNCSFAKTPITVTAFPTSVNDGAPGGDHTPPAPQNSALPSITGSPGVGRVLTGSPGTWAPSTGVFFLRAWLLCADSTTLGSCTAISGQEGPTYTPVSGDENKFIRLRVTGTNAGGSVSATSPATASVVPDSDADGTPDDTDCSPADARLPGPGHPDAPSCAGTVYQASNGTGVDGAVVALSNVLVSAVKSVDDGTVYVQIKPGDAAYDVVAGPKNSGLEISDAFGRHVGDRLNIYGTLSLTASGWVLGAETIEVISTLNEATSLASITFTAFDTNRPAFDGALLDLPSITIASIDSAGWHLTGTSLIVDKTLIGTLPAAEVGQNISTLRGIGESYGSDFKVMPRTASDIVLDPVGCSLPGIESIEAPTTDC